uniref:hypothetical protein n=1 Tax=Xanthomonas fragariae TaxID=48664 RepID=UPI00131F0137
HPGRCVQRRVQDAFVGHGRPSGNGGSAIIAAARTGLGATLRDWPWPWCRAMGVLGALHAVYPLAGNL